MASPIQWTWTWGNSGRRYGTGSLLCCSSRGGRQSDTAWHLNSRRLGLSSSQHKRDLWLYEVMGVAYYGEHSPIHTRIRSLCCTPGTHTTLHIDHISTNLEKLHIGCIGGTRFEFLTCVISSFLCSHSVLILYLWNSIFNVSDHKILSSPSFPLEVFQHVKALKSAGTELCCLPASISEWGLVLGCLSAPCTQGVLFCVHVFFGSPLPEIFWKLFLALMLNVSHFLLLRMLKMPFQSKDFWFSPARDILVYQNVLIIFSFSLFLFSSFSQLLLAEFWVSCICLFMP